jgi:hypothetical protein
VDALEPQQNDAGNLPTFGENADQGSDQSSDEGDSAAAKEREEQYREELRRPMSPMPVQLAMSYTKNDGSPMDAKDSELYLASFHNFSFLPINTAFYRNDQNGVCWYGKCAVWKSPNLCYQPLYFEDVNLERFGADRHCWQPPVSALHFFASLVKLPYHMGMDHPCECQYVAGFGRPGNRYCLQAEKTVWNTRGITFQALFATGAAFALP